MSTRRRADSVPEGTPVNRSNGRSEATVCPGGREDCSGTHPPPAPQVAITATSWRQSAVTWGMLGLLLVALYAGYQGLRTVRDDIRHDRVSAITGHDQRAAAHPDIRAAVRTAGQRIERRVAEVRGEVQALRQEIRAALSKRRRGRHR